MNANGDSLGERDRCAIVIGGSMSGLLAARILTQHFERVTIIERDRFPEQPAHRPGIPQSYHVHVLLDRGRRILESLFPGFQEEIVAAGAHPLDMSADLPWLTPFGWAARFPTDLVLLSCSRLLLEWLVRRRLAAFPQVEWIQETQVQELLPEAEGTGVAGVLLGKNGREERLSADLVVDASGRASKAPHWLQNLGYSSPSETIVNARISYASRLYQRPDNFQADWQGVLFQAAPPLQPRGAILFPLEGDLWIATLASGGGDYPPTDEAGFLEFARSIPHCQIYDLLQEAEPQSPIYGYRDIQNRLRHYERLSRLPDGFVAIGDSVCAFNPIYGQGMSAAAVSALVLDRALNRQRQRDPQGSLAGFSRHFHQQLARSNAPLWQLASSEDCRYRSVTGLSPTFAMRLMHRYMDRVVALTTKSVFARRTMLNIFNLLEPPSAVFHPRIAVQVLKPSKIANPPPFAPISTQGRLFQ
ncbi:MAG: 2-polyprenyl-6-methoxyphenol hydroxylase-like oxidoreductase [Cyanobacteriota bacterium]|nr:2-polyprenyl-6-methoxyphenol hydroxylase-like oxidoreductase [Cyanobacteriota bacterium]